MKAKSNPEHPRWLVLLGVLILPAAAMAQGAPLASVAAVTLDNTNFFVSVQLDNVRTSHVWFLISHDGPGETAQFTKVTDCVMPSSTSMVITDVSAPLPYEGRTYYGATYLGSLCCCTNLSCSECGKVLTKNAVYVPYPFFSNPVISAVSIPADGVTCVTYGEGLYTNTVAISNFPGAGAGFLWVWSSNNIPTNAQIHGSGAVPR